MKKILFILAAAATMTLSSCGSKGTADAEAADSTAVATEQVADEQPAAADTLTSATVTELKAGETINPETLPVVVDFNATWCGPCKAFAPTFHEVAAEYAAKAQFVSVDVDVCEALAKENNITSIPNVTIFYPAASGRAKVSHEGRMTKEEFQAFLDKNL